MGEIVQLQIGQAGNRIGHKFWQQLLLEHNIDQQGYLKSLQMNPKMPFQSSTSKPSIFFNPEDEIFRPRCLLVDTDPSTLDQTLRSNLSNLFCPSTLPPSYLFSPFCHTYSSAYALPSSQKSLVFQLLQSQLEKCDRVSGFSILGSLCGGSSGLGSIIMERIQEQYGGISALWSGILPSREIGNGPIEVYNAVLAMTSFGDNFGAIFFQNQKFFKQKKYRFKEVLDSALTYDDINKKIANGLTNLTSSIRFSNTDGSVSFRKLFNNLINFPNLKYFVMSMPYQISQVKQKIQLNTLGNIIKLKMLNYGNLSISIEKTEQLKHRWIASYFIYRGNTQQPFSLNHKISVQLKRKYYKRYSYGQFKQMFYIQHLPHNCIASCLPPPPVCPLAFRSQTLTCIHNSSSIAQTLKDLHEKASIMSRKRIYLHCYQIQIDQIHEALTDIIDIVECYQDLINHQYCGGEEESSGSDC